MTTWLNTSFEMRFRVIDGLTIRYAQSEDYSGHVLLLSPWPESLLAFMSMWEPLAQYAHLVEIDLPGFRHSQHGALLSPRAMAEFVLRAAAVPVQPGGVLKDWVEAAELEEFRRADPRRLLGDILSSVGRYALADPVREDYLSSYQGNRRAESMRYVRSYPTELPVLSGLLQQVDTAVQIIAGTHDTVVSAANAEYLHQRLPHGKLNVIDAGHFTWEDAPGEYAALVTSWWGGDYLASTAKE